MTNCVFDSPLLVANYQFFHGFPPKFSTATKQTVEVLGERTGLLQPLDFASVDQHQITPDWISYLLACHLAPKKGALIANLV